MNEINPGDRVQTRKWTELHTGTVTNVSDDGESIYVKWDGATFSEDEMDRDEVYPVEGHGDPAVPYAVIEGRS